MDIKLIIFFVISAVTILSAAVVAFSRNILYSAFALLGVFAGVLGLYIMLSADFVAIAQLVIYIGGILVLILFAVMLTSKIEKVSGKRELLNRAAEPFAACIGIIVFGILIWRTISGGDWLSRLTERYSPTTATIGNKLLQEYLLPFEIISLLLVLVLVGSIVLARREVT
jgi:NADH-quinone oxidoreductase subunit J